MSNVYNNGTGRLIRSDYNFVVVVFLVENIQTHRYEVYFWESSAFHIGAVLLFASSILAIGNNTNNQNHTQDDAFNIIIISFP